MQLKRIFRDIVSPRPPYNFNLSVYNPSYYPVPTNFWRRGKLWFTMRWDGVAYGVRLANSGSVSRPLVEVTVYGRQRLTGAKSRQFLEELAFRFEWDVDYSEFYRAVGHDGLAGPVVKSFTGMRNFCIESLYELLMICILLQNAPVKRTESMTRATLEKYGDLLAFDGRKLYCFWPPRRILSSSVDELRALKVGYRAKSFLRATSDCVLLDELKLRLLDDESLLKSLLSIYGVGPATADYLMTGAFHRAAAFKTIPPWEAKIFSRILFSKPSVSPTRVLRELVRRYGAWRGLAAHYLFMDLCWRHKARPVEWFSKLMPY